jgi:tetratricopeptide (TPR) repeat protein
MTYQLPPLLDDDEFERLVRDIVRRVHNDPGIERLGRKGQSQSGIDGFSPANSSITFQCKLKDTRYETDEHIRAVLMKEMEAELTKTAGLGRPLTRFIFASTFKNDTHLQKKASSLSSDILTVEYWGWDSINERIWEFAEELIPIYYPEVPVRAVHGFRQITPHLIETSRIANRDQLNKLALDYYRINDRSDVVFQVVCNDLDVRNDRVMETVYQRLAALTPSGTLWLVGSGGSGKTTILHRVALELAESSQSVFMLNLEAHLTQADVESTLSIIKFCSTGERPVLCIDNPAADELALERILREVPDYSADIQVILSEREHRYDALRRTGVLTHLHGEEENKPVRVRNPRSQREDVYNKLFDLLDLSEADREPLREIVRNESLVYVNATYSILVELKKQRKIDFDFDWDDYRKTASATPAFIEGYKYIALFYLFGVRTPFSTFSRLCGSDDAQRRLFLEKFRGEVNEPIIVDEWRDESFRKIIHLRTKHEIVSEIFFREHEEINKDELLMEWCEQVDFEDPLAAQALINVFGAKKNYSGEDSAIEFNKLLDFLLTGYINDRVALSPKLHATLYLARSWLLLADNNLEQAVAILRELLERQPNNLHCRTELARIYQAQGKFENAEDILQELLAIEFESVWARTELARIYQRTGRLAEAESMLVAILDSRPSDLKSRTELAKVYQRQNRLSKAEEVLLEALEYRRNDLNSRTELAKIYQRQGKLDDAESILLELLQIDKDSIRARTELAKVYQRQNKLDEAEAVLKIVLTFSEDDLNSRTELAKIYQRQGKLAEAEKLLLESLEIDNKQLHPRTELAKIYQRQGKLAEAEKLLLESLEIDNKQLHPRTELAKIYQRQGKLAEAEKLLLESLDIDDKQLHPRLELAKIYQRQNKLEEAIQRLEEYLNLNPVGDQRLHPRTELAKIYQRQGKLNEAATTAEEILAFDPLNDFAMSELLGVWNRQGEKDKCRDRFLAFIGQPRYKFTRYSQAPMFRFFQCCRKFGMKDEAKMVFERFKSQLDDRNIDLYKSTWET